MQFSSVAPNKTYTLSVRVSQPVYYFFAQLKHNTSSFLWSQLTLYFVVRDGKTTNQTKRHQLSRQFVPFFFSSKALHQQLYFFLSFHSHFFPFFSSLYCCSTLFHSIHPKANSASSSGNQHYTPTCNVCFIYVSLYNVFIFASFVRFFLINMKE